MKRIMWGTIFVFVGIMLFVIFLAIQNPVQMVTYKNGAVVEQTP